MRRGRVIQYAMAKTTAASRPMVAPGGASRARPSTTADRTDRFEIAESLTSHHHHHLVCTECGVVNDFDPSPQLERLITKELQSLLASAGFAESHHLFDVPGICGNCRPL
jgi:hypothetical protein